MGEIFILMYFYLPLSEKQDSRVNPIYFRFLAHVNKKRETEEFYLPYEFYYLPLSEHKVGVRKFVLLSFSL